MFKPIQFKYHKFRGRFFTQISLKRLHTKMVAILITFVLKDVQTPF